MSARFEIRLSLLQRRTFEKGKPVDGQPLSPGKVRRRLAVAGGMALLLLTAGCGTNASGSGFIQEDSQVAGLAQPDDGKMILAPAAQQAVEKAPQQPAPPAQALPNNKLYCPLPGSVVTQPFGPSTLPGEPAVFGYNHFHTGIDRAYTGTRTLNSEQNTAGKPIHAAEGGRVIFAGNGGGYGNLTEIQGADGRIDFYGHQSRFAVKAGDIIEGNQVIGYVGSTGYSTASHLHFEIRQNGRTIASSIDSATITNPC